MSSDKHDATPRTDAAKFMAFGIGSGVPGEYVEVEVARQLERDLAAERRRAEAFKEAMHSYEQAARFERDKPVSSTREPDSQKLADDLFLVIYELDHNDEISSEGRSRLISVREQLLHAPVSAIAPNTIMRDALKRIEKWFGEFPPSGHFFPTTTNGKKTEMSYGMAHGSNGERDYMRGVAREALRRADDGAGKA